MLSITSASYLVMFVCFGWFYLKNEFVLIYVHRKSAKSNQFQVEKIIV